MKRVLLGSVWHEANTFVPGVADLEDFRHYYVVEGQDVFGPGRGRGQEVDGVIQVANEEGVDLIPTIATAMGAAPPASDYVFEYVRDRILAGAKEHRGRLDGVMLTLHGAMTTPSREDPEGEIISAVRQVVGPEVPIAVSFDMHCHMTDLKLKSADIIVGYHTHPHVDFFDTGVRAMRILARSLRGEVRPVVAGRKLRMISSAERHNTSRKPMVEVMGRALEMEQEPGVLAATVFPTQPWMDVETLGWTTVVVADGDRAVGQARADELGGLAWERRQQFLVRKTPIKEAIERSVAGQGQPFVLADSADSVTGGGHGDGNFLLQTMLAVGYGDTAMLTITDPEAVDACFAAGEGAEITIPVGGKLTPQFFQPVMVTGRVGKLVERNRYVAVLPPGPVDIGRTAVLQIGGISILLSQRKAPTMDAEAYHSVGLEPREVKIAQVKSPGGFRAIYEPFAAGIFELDAPGPCDSELTRLPFRRIRRPLWPFDPELQTPW